MQRRWKLDQYLSYLSAPPLLCCCSSLWSPERQRQATRHGWTDGQKGGRQPDRRVRMGVTWAAVGRVWTLYSYGHADNLTDRRDGRMTPSQEHKPASTPESEQRPVTVAQFNGSASLCDRFSNKIQKKKTSKCSRTAKNVVLNGLIHAVVINV